VAVLGNPAFLFTYAVIQAGVLLILIRYLDLYDRQPLGFVTLVAVWGATGAAAISVIGNGFVRGLLHGDVRVVFGDAIAAPLVEEAAKGLALLAAVGPVRALARRAGISLFEGVGAGVVYGAAVGIGFGFTEDVAFLVDTARIQGIEAGLQTFVYRRDFFGPAILHHALFTAAFGAGLGVAMWTSRRALKVVLPMAGFVLAVLMHAVNNGLVELVVVIAHGVRVAAIWVSAPSAAPAAQSTADRLTALMRAIDFLYLSMFLAVVGLWTRRQRRIIEEELAEEVDLGLITPKDHAQMFDVPQRAAGEWGLLRTGQLERLRHERRLRSELAQLGLLKWRTRRFGGSSARLHRARRQIATLSTYEVAAFEAPVPATPLIGRDHEVEEIVGLLVRPDVRAVTLTGPGGTGKTRLAIEAASDQRDRFSGGVYFVELAGVSDPELVPSAIARVLGVQPAPGESVVDALGEHLRDKHVLLVLDNFEQVVDAAPAVARMLTAAARAKLLVTSRQPLRIAGEHEAPVPPLSLPDPDADADSLADNAAVALFVDRARAVDPGFELSAATAAAVARICTALDGLPLAIELAAARMNVLAPEAILERLGRPLQVLTAGVRDADARHQTLRGTMDWSFDLLDRREQVLFARLGVFVDGADLEAVEQVCLDGDDAADTVLDTLGSLLDKSLVRRGGGAGGQPRFGMLGTVREYAVDRLVASGELAALRRRHACYAAELAERAEEHVHGPDQARWIARLDQEVGNSRAALSWCEETGELELGLRLVAALPRFWSVRGLTDPPRWLASALEGGAGGADVAPPVRAKALFAAGYAALDHGDFARAEEHFGASMNAYRQLDQPAAAAACSAQLGVLLMARGEHGQAVALAQENLSIARGLHDRRVESLSLSTLADGATRAGDLDRASDLYEQSLAVQRQLGDRRTIAAELLNLGRVQLLRAEHEQARALLEEGVEAGREVGDTWSISVGLASLGRLALATGRHGEGVELLGQALELAIQRGGQRVAAECLAALADAAKSDEPTRAVRLLASAEALRRTAGASLSPVELAMTAESLDDLRLALGEDGFSTHWEAGLALPIGDAVIYALSRTSKGQAKGGALDRK
jgi:predicted ATPase/RsiW-degrading membrane proteinase PrsW (M82 family)